MFKNIHAAGAAIAITAGLLASAPATSRADCGDDYNCSEKLRDAYGEIVRSDPRDFLDHVKEAGKAVYNCVTCGGDVAVKAIRNFSSAAPNR